MDSITQELIALALQEDLGPGDVTSVLVPENKLGEGRFVAKSDLVLAGIDAAAEVFLQVDEELDIFFDLDNGARLKKGTTFGQVRGSARSILSAERVALNLLQRLSGIATFARKCSDAVAHTDAKVIDTRKTTPGLRALEKAAVRAGGAMNHRFGLFDGILIKDNHIAAVGGVKKAINAVRKHNHHLLKIECEVDDLAGFDEALAAGADVILLDNMSTADMATAVKKNDGRAVLEASGNMSLERLKEVAETGVHFISMGALTHTVTAADISLDWA